MFAGKTSSLLGERHSASLADDGDLHLSWVGHLILNLLGDVGAECINFLVRNLVGTYDDTQLAASLDGISLYEHQDEHH